VDTASRKITSRCAQADEPLTKAERTEAPKRPARLNNGNAKGHPMDALFVEIPLELQCATYDLRSRGDSELRRDHDHTVRRVGTVLLERSVTLDHLNLGDLVGRQRWHLITLEPYTVDYEEKGNLRHAGRDRGCGRVSGGWSG
jgi:hypothetical protein